MVPSKKYVIYGTLLMVPMNCTVSMVPSQQHAAAAHIFLTVLSVHHMKNAIPPTPTRT